LLREESSLCAGQQLRADCAEGIARMAKGGKVGRRLVEGEALCTVAEAILDSALARTESRGAHFREDFPKRDDARFRKHSIFRRDGTGEGRVTFETW
jgi:L-aspartate oxidase